MIFKKDLLSNLKFYKQLKLNISLQQLKKHKKYPGKTNQIQIPYKCQKKLKFFFYNFAILPIKLFELTSYFQWNRIKKLIKSTVECSQCKYDYELIELFPLVGYGITINKIKKKSETKIKVTQFSKVEKIIDLSYLDLKIIQRTEGKANCILPLLSSQEDNAELLNCELFKRKISYLVHQKLDSYKEDTFIQLLQAIVVLISIYYSIHHIIKKEGNQSWGREILVLIFETCKQVFVNTQLFCNSIVSQQFQQSKFQLLNLFCLFNMGQLTTEEIFDNYIGPNIEFQKNERFDEDKLQLFFDKLRFENLDQIYQNINQFMKNYLRENNYFIIQLHQKKIIQGLLGYMILKEDQWSYIKKLKQVQDQKKDLKDFKYHTISTIYLQLLNNLFEEYSDEKKNKYFESFSHHYDKDNDIYNFQSFLMSHKNNKYIDIHQIYELFSQTNNNYLVFDPVIIEKYQTIAIRFILKKISIDSIKSQNPESFQDLSRLQELEKITDYLQIFQKIFKFSEEQAKGIHCSIIEELKNLTWLNYLSASTNFKEENSIKQFLEKFLYHLKNWKSIQQQDDCANNLNELARFTFLLLQRTRLLREINRFKYLEDIMTKENQKIYFCKKIYEVSQTLNR